MKIKLFMELQIHISLIIILILLSFVSPDSDQLDQSLQTYIVQLHPHDTSFFPSKRQWHLSFIHKSSLPKHRMLYSYTSTMEGFAARLSQSEIASMKKLPGVLSVRPDRKLHLHTTYSYKFLGLNPNSPRSAWVRSRFGRGAIIGVLDTGVWPESPSFDDTGMPPIPKKWKGKCEEGKEFNASNCNRKLIGARFFAKGHRVASSSNLPPGTYLKEYASPRDSHGHGTHTSSTAGGGAVPTASVLGNGAGVARGMAPGAHIAVYKVCWFSGCYSSDILAAMDVAIRDGVDILSLSLGSFPIPLYDDTIAIGSFRAVEHGVTVVCSAGNNGPIPSSVANEAPWIITVGASTLDRRFPAPVRTRNNDVLYGESMYPRMNQLAKMEQLDLIYLHGSELCLQGSLPKDKVRGKIVVCDRGANGRAEKGEVVKEAGGAAMILATTEINDEDDSADVHVLPATQLGFHESMRLKSYINSTSRPMARIEFDGTVIEKDMSAPAVARFSSRGPSLTDPSVLKPDVIAPGVNIIAAWPQNLGPSGLPEDSRRVNFTVMSGTSMSCPHVSGIAALVRSAHPDWSPAAIKSAIMTTSDATDHLRKPFMDGHDHIASVFAIGSGQVRLVYIHNLNI